MDRLHFVYPRVSQWALGLFNRCLAVMNDAALSVCSRCSAFLCVGYISRSAWGLWHKLSLFEESLVFELYLLLCILKHTFQWHAVHSPCCATITAFLLAGLGETMDTSPWAPERGG